MAIESVLKRNGEYEVFDSKKIENVLTWACEGLENVSVVDIIIKANFNLYDGIKTSRIHKSLISSAYELIDIKHTDYEYVASRLLSMFTRKQIFNVYLDKDLPTIREVFKTNVELGFYDPHLLDKFDEATIDKFEKLIDHTNDLKLPYSAYRKIIDSYSAKDRTTNWIYETPQYIFMFMAIFFSDTYEQVKENYLAMVNKEDSYPTPILSGARTSTPQFASCAVIECDDSLDSIIATVGSGIKLVAKKFGIGYGMGRLRSEGSAIRNGEVKHTGVIPFYRLLQSATNSCSQGGVRKGSATIYYPIWCREVQYLIPLKNNKGTDDTRVRDMDYCIVNHGYFLDRMLEDKPISLFSSGDVPNLYETYGLDGFVELYEKYENDLSIPRVTVGGKELLLEITTETPNTGRLYQMFIDNVNKQNRFKDPIRQSNLCCEIVLPTTPLNELNDEDGEIALCNLGAVNLGAVADGDYTKLRPILHRLVRNIDFIIDKQKYYVKATEKQLKRRSLGIGVTNFAYWLAEMGLDYESKESLIEIDKLYEHFQYYLLEGSMILAKEKGQCEWFDRTRYSEGFLPIDEMNVHVQDLIDNRELSLDWEKLRRQIKKYGLRNSVLSAQMPVESSSLVTSTTNGIQPPRDLITVKKNSTSGNIKVVAPKALELAGNYTTAWDLMRNTGMINVVSVMQKWLDQAISVDRYYNKNLYSDRLVPAKEIIEDVIQFYDLGGKCLYYANINDSNIDEDYEVDCDACKI